MPVQDIHLIDTREKIIVGGADDLPLFHEWARRFSAERSKHTYQKLTEASLHADMILAGDMPAGFSDVLDAAETIDSGWRTIPCWQIVANDDRWKERFEQALKEVMMVFNAYCSVGTKVQDSYIARLRAVGYPENLLAALKPQVIEDIKPGDDME